MLEDSFSHLPGLRRRGDTVRVPQNRTVLVARSRGPGLCLSESRLDKDLSLCSKGRFPSPAALPSPFCVSEAISLCSACCHSGAVPCQASSSCSGSISALWGQSRPQRPSLHPQMSLSLLSGFFCGGLVPCTEHHSLCLCCPALPEIILTFSCPDTEHPTLLVPKTPQTPPK